MTLYLTGRDDIHDCVNTICMLIDTIQSDWTANQWQAVAYYSRLKTMKEVGLHLGISGQAVEKRIRLAHWSDVESAIENLSKILVS